MLYKYKTSMKNLIITLLLFTTNHILSQNHFTHNHLINNVVEDGRWESDIKIFLFGNYTKKDSLEVLKTSKKFNDLSETISINIVDNRDSSNTIIYFLTDEEMKEIYSFSDETDNIGNTYNKIDRYNEHTIIGCEIQIDTYMNKVYDSFDYVIRHEMFHMLGFDHHHHEDNSIMVLENFTEKDEEMIKYLYSKDFKF